MLKTLSIGENFRRSQAGSTAIQQVGKPALRRQAGRRKSSSLRTCWAIAVQSGNRRVDRKIDDRKMEGIGTGSRNGSCAGFPNLLYRRFPIGRAVKTLSIGENFLGRV